MERWAQGEPTVRGLALIGSRERGGAERLGAPDAHSDWDFHLISSRPRMFLDGRWTRGLAGAELRAYAARTAAIGGVPKVNLVFSGAEADLVILPLRVIRGLRFRAALGLHRREGSTRRQLQALAVVVRPGWRFLKGAGAWDGIYRRAVAEADDPRIGDAAARRLADAFVCDYVWTRRKIARGELRAAQRMLHRELAETNYRLLHELKLRRGELTFPEARRIEWSSGGDELEAVTVAGPRSTPAALRAAA